MRWIIVCALLLFPLTACDDETSGTDPTDDPPQAPDENDPAYTLGPVRTWNLVGNTATEGHDEIVLEVVAPPDVGEIRAWLDDEVLVTLEPDSDAFRSDVDISGLDPGRYEILLQADGDDLAFAAIEFLRSQPLYIFTSVDWDDADISDNELDWHLSLHDAHPRLLLTEFVGPYTFTEDNTDEERRGELVDWLLDLRDVHGAEIGLHIHPYCTFVEYAGVECRTEPSFYDDAGDDTGYTVFNTAYTEDEYVTLLEAADEIFVERGLGKPITYRAGGWTADAGVLRALAASGFVADTSAANWSCLEEWDGSANGELWAFLTDQWSEIDETSQPYFPSQDDAGVPGDPAIPILEVPDNACLADYVSGDEMIAVLDANFAGDPLDEPKAWSIGFHNRTAGFMTDFRTPIEEALTYADALLAVDDGGPLVYGTLSDAALVWEWEG